LIILVISSAGSILQANDLAIARLCYSHEDIKSLSIQEIIPENHRKDMENFMTSVFQNKWGKIETIFLTKKGERIDMEVSATAILDSSESVTGARLFSQDITERKKLEEQLIQSERLAIIGEVAAGIAHEINNPLAIVVGNIDELLRSRSNSDSEYEDLHSIKENALRAATFLQDMLTFAKPTRSHPIPMPISVEDLLEDCLFLLKQDIKKNFVQVKKDLFPKTLQIWGDTQQIQQVFINLIMNSIQAMPKGGLITVKGYSHISGTKPMVHIEIADTGEGIPVENLEKVFDPFFTARKPKGFGLGLSISRRIIEKHNGTIKVGSDVKKGTLVTVELPAVA
jgi:PAS domain S-box-containing protein